ncbi:hypothetical protein [Streptomyces sp. NPDC055243]|uniref:hypothetical protein n=1 Tax=Streptomyces sp. NPDC055243 TaxID=3365720 RepID=UPI0037D6D120
MQNVMITARAAAGAGPPAVPVTDLPATPEEEPELGALDAWWRRHVLAPHTVAQALFLTTTADPTADPTVEHLGRQRPFLVRFGADHLDDLATAYANLGWDAVELVEPRMRELGLPDGLVRFHRLTRRVLELMIGQALVRVERRATAYAKTAWADARRTLVGHKADFRPPYEGWRTMGIRFVRKATQDAVLEHGHTYLVALDEARRLGEKMADRDRKDPPRTRVPGSGAALWYQMYADAQEAELDVMHGALREVHAACPAALLVLDDLPDTLRTSPKDPHLPYTVAAQISVRLDGLIAELDRLTHAAEHRAPDTEWITFEAPRTDERADRGITHVEARTLDIVLAKGSEELGVLANPYLLADFAVRDDRAGPWDRIVLRRYRAGLDARLKEQARDRAAWAAFWDVLARVAAALSLLALGALVPGAPLALAAGLGLLGHAAFLLGIVMLLLHEILGTLATAGTVEAQARARLFRLGRDDPGALREVGALVARSEALRRGLGEGLLTVLFRIGLARFKILAAALEADDTLGDLETLFGPAPVPERAETP